MSAQWQPIETAPRDGTRVLLSRPSKTVCIGYYDAGTWWQMQPTSGGYAIYPTHWMPLPEPPR